MRFNAISKGKILNIATFLLTNSPLTMFNGCQKLRAKKAQRDISTTISTKFNIIIIDRRDLRSRLNEVASV